VSSTQYVSYDSMACMMKNNSDLIDCFIVGYCSEVEGTQRNVLLKLQDPYVKEVMSIMTGSLEKFSLPYMKQMAFTDSLTEYKTAIKAWESRLLALYQDRAALARFFGSSTKGQCNFLPLINGDEERVPHTAGKKYANGWRMQEVCMCMLLCIRSAPCSKCACCIHAEIMHPELALHICSGYAPCTYLHNYCSLLKNFIIFSCSLEQKCWHSVFLQVSSSTSYWG
jgi:hypothetical protein